MIKLFKKVCLKCILGDSFLFRCGPPMEVFKWQPDGNFYFIHSEESFLRVGAGK